MLLTMQLRDLWRAAALVQVSLWCIKEASLGRGHKLRERGKKGKRGRQRPAV